MPQPTHDAQGYTKLAQMPRPLIGRASPLHEQSSASAIDAGPVWPTATIGPHVMTGVHGPLGGPARPPAHE